MRKNSFVLDYRYDPNSFMKARIKFGIINRLSTLIVNTLMDKCLPFLEQNRIIIDVEEIVKRWPSSHLSQRI